MKKKNEQLTQEVAAKESVSQSKGARMLVLPDKASTEGGVGKKEFSDFNPFEYSLFWVLQLIIIFCVIEFFGGDLEKSLHVFFEVLNPLNWK